MKSALRISLLANIALCVVALHLVRHESAGLPESSARPAIPALNTAGPYSITQAMSLKTPPNAEQTPFHWEQIESADYRTYVANLRKAGCPEQTVRDIIVADVHSLYVARRRELEPKQAALDEGRGSAGSAYGQTSGSDLQKLQDEETAVIAALLGSKPVSDPPAAESALRSPSPERPLRRQDDGGPAPMPVAFQSVGTDLKLDRAQTAVLEDLRERFVADIGGLGQDTNDPTYLRRWQEAQCKSDDLLQAFLGGEFFVNYQMLGTDGAASAP